MEKFDKHKGLVMPLDRHNVDTDAIIPKQFLKSIKRSGFGRNLFDEWRYHDHGEPGMDHAKRKKNTGFVLNHPRYEGASDNLSSEMNKYKTTLQSSLSYVNTIISFLEQKKRGKKLRK